MSSSEDVPPSFEAMGIPLVPKTQTTPLGKIRSWASLCWLEVGYLAGSAVAVLMTLAFGVALLCTIAADSEDRALIWLLFITAGFSLLYAFNGVLREQLYELLAYAVAAVVLMAYVLLNYLDPRTPVSTFKLVRVVLAWTLSVPLVAVAACLAVRYYRSNELVFRTVGANVRLQAACRRVFSTQSLLKLDAQLALSTVVLVLHGSFSDITPLETAVLSVGVAVTVLWWIGGYAALRWEVRPLIWVLVLTCAVEPAYIIWKLSTETRPVSAVVLCQRVAGALALGIRALLVAHLAACAANFGLGVAQQMYPQGLLSAPPPPESYSTFTGVPGPVPSPPPTPVPAPSAGPSPPEKSEE